MPRYWVWWLLLLVSPAVYAAAPSQEFWEYMADYSDENGEVLDPLELDEAISAKEQDVYGAGQSKQDAGQRKREAASEPAPDDSESQIKNADLKATTKSSATTMSRKGATL